MNDKLLMLYSGSLSGTPGAQTGALLGKNRVFRAWGRCAGDVTGAGATCSMAIEEATTLGGSYTVVPGSGTLAITEQYGGVNGTTPAPEIPTAVIPLPSIVFTTTKDYVRVNVTLAGTSPVFPGTTVYCEPIDAPSVPSGR